MRRNFRFTVLLSLVLWCAIIWIADYLTGCATSVELKASSVPCQDATPEVCPKACSCRAKDER
jgi:hypothetical protein